MSHVSCPLLAALIALVTAFSTSAALERPLMRDFIGVNGHTVQFKPELYAPVCRLVRDYHPVSWDLGTNTAELPPFPFAKNRVDWSKVYGSWRSSGYITDVSLMFESIDRSRWSNVRDDARAYGRAFAGEFGPSGPRRLVASVEIGNEPGEWSDEVYARLFEGFASGIREGDPALTIATCNLTAGKSGRYEKSVTCVATLTNLFDILTVHSYPMLDHWPTWRRSFPEDPRLAKFLPDIEAVCHWRDTHAPQKPVWITEFGYDSSTKSADSADPSSKWVGVTDEQQAQWLVRSLLVFSAMPVQRAYIYFFNDDDKPSFHASSGLTRHFQPKPSYYAVAGLFRTLGDYRFHSIIKNDAGLRIYAYQHGAVPGRVAWVAWVPTAEGRPARTTLTGLPGKFTGAERLALTPAPVRLSLKETNGTLTPELTATPAVFFFDPK